MAARTLRSTSAEKRCVPLTNFETVEMETPAADAMSRMVSLLFIGCASIKESVFPRSPALCSARGGAERVFYPFSSDWVFGAFSHSSAAAFQGGLRRADR